MSIIKSSITTKDAVLGVYDPFELFTSHPLDSTENGNFLRSSAISSWAEHTSIVQVAAVWYESSLDHEDYGHEACVILTPCVLRSKKLHDCTKESDENPAPVVSTSFPTEDQSVEDMSIVPINLRSVTLHLDEIPRIFDEEGDGEKGPHIVRRVHRGVVDMADLQSYIETTLAVEKI